MEGRRYPLPLEPLPLLMRRFCYALTALALWSFSPASAATITVNTTADELNADGDCSLREAVEAANTNAAVDGCTAGTSGADTIEFAGALAGGTVTLGTSGLRTLEDVAIDGAAGASGRITISGNNANRVLLARAGTLTLRNLVIRNGREVRGSGVLVSPGLPAVGTTPAVPNRLTADNVDFVDNVATGTTATDGGAALYLSTITTATLTNCTFTGNTASGTSGSGGAVLNNGGTLTMTGSSFSGNSARRAGGAIESAGASTTTLTNTTFTNNTAASRPGNGGAFHISGAGSATVTGGTVTGNTAATEGGGFWNSTGTMTLSGVTFTGNTAQGDSTATGGPVGGGAVFNNGGTLLATNVTATGNSATGFRGSGGALMSSGGTMTVTGGTFSGNTANRAGAGIESAGATTTLTSVTVRNNDIPAATARPGNGGGVHAAGDTLIVRGGLFEDNDATEGGGIWASGVLNIARTTANPTTIRNNTGRGAAADNGGGGIYVEAGGRATISGATISGNKATGAAGSGGGVLVAAGTTAATAASATISQTTISGNTANRAGAGIENSRGTVTLTNVAVTDNVIPAATAAPGNGGGLHSGGGTVTVNGGTFSGNQATEGGGLWSNATLTVQPDTLQTTAARLARITGNVGRGAAADNGGGGVYAETGAVVSIMQALIDGNSATGAAGSGGGILVADSSSVTVVGGSISNNRANRAGAGIEVADDPATGSDGDPATTEGADTVLSLTQVMVAGNAIATAAPGNGGGLHIGGAGEVAVLQSTFSGNRATEGAGLWAAPPSTLAIDLSTVSGNAATAAGGGVYDDGGATISIESSTVALNTAGTNGGGLLSKTTAGFTFANTIVAGNTAGGTGPNCSGTFVSGDFNLVQTVAGCTITGATANNVTGQSPMLGPLADNGGPTMTHLPMAGSPVIDAGQSAFGFDQRGLNRTDAQNDIGSVEAAASPVDDEVGPGATTLAFLPTRPNPARDVARVTFTVAEASPVRVELYNLLGQRVQVLFEGTMAAGAEQSVDVDASRLAAGVYVLRLESDGEQVMQRLTVVR